ncbi:MAG TPA: hypothetical protein VMB47_14175 [Candidatus Aquilonibacter sp.]|nr:hypothetical protein [Candidatus Aquilonibacter sp.]
MPENRNEPEIREEDIRRFEAEAASRLSNVLPLDAARNEGRFYGQLIRGRPLNAVQRIGFFLIGLLFCFSGIFGLAGALPKLAGLVGLALTPMDRGPSPFYIPFAAVSLLLGLAAIGKSLAPRRHGPRAN